MSPQEFGLAFLDAAVTPERIRAAVARIAGEQVEVGPVTAGPGGAATAHASGRVVDVAVTRSADLCFDVVIRVDLALAVTVAGGASSYAVVAEMPVALAVRLHRPLTLVIDPVPPSPRDVRVQVRADGLKAKLLQRAGDLEGELRRQIADYVAGRLTSDDAQALTRIEVEPLIERGWG